MKPMTLLSLFLIALFLKLGFWQLGRAHEKQILLSAAASQATRPFKDWRVGDAIPQNYTPLRIRGHFLKKNLLLDNQTRNHQWGYHVLNLFALSSGEGVVVVDRGWIAQQEGDRKKIPLIQIPTGIMTVHGYVFIPSSKGFLLGDMVDRREGNTLVMEKVDLNEWRKILHKPLYPFIIRLDQKESYGYLCKWPLVNMSPARHKAYAFQWFAMAAVVIVLYGNFFRRHRSGRHL